MIPGILSNEQSNDWGALTVPTELVISLCRNASAARYNVLQQSPGEFAGARIRARAYNYVAVP